MKLHGEEYSHSGWCSVNVSTDDIIPHSGSVLYSGVRVDVI